VTWAFQDWFAHEAILVYRSKVMQQAHIPCISLLFPIFLRTTFLFSQSDPQAVSLAQKSMAALTGGNRKR
jgi:hypothetical protein